MGAKGRGSVPGYEARSRIARRTLDEKRTVAAIVLEEGLLTEARLSELLRLEAMTRPSRIVVASATKPKG
jgi:aspartate ammonia-lyase